jgi:hypothetical protein
MIRWSHPVFALILLLKLMLMDNIFEFSSPIRDEADDETSDSTPAWNLEKYDY